VSGFERLFSPLTLKGLSLKNRITMAPLYLGFPGEDGLVNDLVLDHYREMASSGAAMIVVENAGVDPGGVGSPRTLLASDDRFVPGLAELARTIKGQGAVAIQQINHAGRYACGTERIAPSPVETWGVVPRAMTEEDMDRVVEMYASAAARVKAAGFDGVEIHGGTGYLLVQFLSTRTNHRTDGYGGSLDNRLRFPLRVVDAVLDRVGPDFPVGYRFLVEEFLPDGLQPYETQALGQALDDRGIAYLSVTFGTYDSFFTPKYMQAEKKEGFMYIQSGLVKRAFPDMPVITSGRIQSPARAERLLEEGDGDMVGLARVLFADPLWPKKAQGLVTDPIVPCEPTCSLCLNRVIHKQAAMCSRWGKDRIRAFKARLGETPEPADQDD
jgi:2,4-dienoyl-CoA reductase (NADPH2)